MPQPKILAMAQGVAPHIFEQSSIAKNICQQLDLHGKSAKAIQRIFANTSIAKRHSVLPEPIDSTLGMAARNALYKREAPQLAARAANNALQKWGGDLSSITHVISVSCTGVIAPGIEFLLAKDLGLDKHVKRLGINFMGCFGAFQGLRTAAQISQNDPNHRVLVVCTELCTLHFQLNDSTESLVINALFADGAAAAIVGSEPCQGKRAYWELVNDASLALDDSVSSMTWEAGNFGYDMTLSTTVAAQLRDKIEGFTQHLLPRALLPSACDWAIHPGGKAIVQAIEQTLDLRPDQTRASWETLANYGNMSSPTFLYVLNRLAADHSTGRQWAAGLGFGPGLSIEGLLLKRC